MTNRNIALPRRKLLVGLGATSAGAIAGLGVGVEGALPYTDAMALTTGDGFTIEADWRETYNGDVLEDTRAQESSDGATISLPNVMPGDSGTFSFRLGVDPDSDSDDISAEPLLSLELTGMKENDITEPERKAGDTTPDEGELQHYLDVKLWFDEGLANFEEFGGDNATQEMGENLIADGAEGTLAQVAQAVDDTELGCLGTDETVTVVFKWELDSEIGNIIQSDSVTFDFNITAKQCP